MRKGTLTDTQTLTLYNNGESLITLAIHEGMTVYGVSHRLRRGRKALGLEGMNRPPSEYPTIDTIDELVRQMNKLTRAVSAMIKASR